MKVNPPPLAGIAARAEGGTAPCYRKLQRRLKRPFWKIVPATAYYQPGCFATGIKAINRYDVYTLTQFLKVVKQFLQVPIGYYSYHNPSHLATVVTKCT